MLFSLDMIGFCVQLLSVEDVEKILDDTQEAVEYQQVSYSHHHPHHHHHHGLKLQPLSHWFYAGSKKASYCTTVLLFTFH